MVDEELLKETDNVMLTLIIEKVREKIKEGKATIEEKENLTYFEKEMILRGGIDGGFIERHFKELKKNHPQLETHYVPTVKNKEGEVRRGASLVVLDKEISPSAREQVVLKIRGGKYDEGCISMREMKDEYPTQEIERVINIKKQQIAQSDMIVLCEDYSGENCESSGTQILIGDNLVFKKTHINDSMREEGLGRDRHEIYWFDTTEGDEKIEKIADYVVDDTLDKAAIRDRRGNSIIFKYSASFADTIPGKAFVLDFNGRTGSLSVRVNQTKKGEVGKFTVNSDGRITKGEPSEMNGFLKFSKDMLSKRVSKEDEEAKVVNTFNMAREALREFGKNRNRGKEYEMRYAAKFNLGGLNRTIPMAIQAKDISILGINSDKMEENENFSKNPKTHRYTLADHVHFPMKNVFAYTQKGATIVKQIEENTYMAVIKKDPKAPKIEKKLTLPTSEEKEIKKQKKRSRGMRM